MFTALASLLECDITVYKMFSSVMLNSLQKCWLMLLSLKRGLTHSPPLHGDSAIFTLISLFFLPSVNVHCIVY